MNVGALSVVMDPSLCLFCDSEYGDPLLPFHVDKIAALCHLVSKEKLANKRMCMRCKLDIDMIENALRLRDIMVGALNMKLTTANNCKRSGAGDNTTHTPSDLSSSALGLQMPLPAPPTLQPVEKRDEVQAMCNPYTGEGVKEEPAVSTSLTSSSNSGASISPAEALINSVSMFAGLPLPMLTNGAYTNGVNSTHNPRPLNRRIPKCHKCNISLKTRPFPDAMKHINKCNGQGVRPGRSSMAPRQTIFPCRLCHRRLATKEALDLHITKCDGTNNNTRGRKPADNTCMLCDENLVYRHILKKHLRQVHGINAQRLDDSVLAALKTGSGTGCNVKEQVLSRIQQKMISDLYEPERAEKELATDNQTTDSQPTNEDSQVEDDDAEENKTPPPADKVGILGNINLSNGSRNRKKMKPCKYVPQVYTCDMCSEQFEYLSQYNQHTCYKVKDADRATSDLADGEVEKQPDIPEKDVEVEDVNMVVENGATQEMCN